MQQLAGNDGFGTTPAARVTVMVGPLARKAHGFALLDLIFVVGIIGLLMTIALPRLVLAQTVAGSATAIGSLRAINSAELTYALTCGNGFYAPTLKTLGTAPPGSNAPYISPDMGNANSVQKAGYLIQLTATPYANAPATCNGLPVGAAGQGFKAGADPMTPGNVSFFATNAYQTIYESTSTLYATMPEVLSSPSGHPLR
jgi:type II secretory pathway pseudopilin PulG